MTLTNIWAYFCVKSSAGIKQLKARLCIKTDIFRKFTRMILETRSTLARLQHYTGRLGVCCKD